MYNHNNLRPIKIANNFSHKLTFVCQFLPDEKKLLEQIRDKKKPIREEALAVFHTYYSQEVESLEGFIIWLSGGVASYKLIDIRKILADINTKIVTRESKKTSLLVVGDKTKVEELPKSMPYISAIRFKKILDDLATKVRKKPVLEKQNEQLIELLLSDEQNVVAEGLRLLENQELSLNILPLVLAIFKVHAQKELRLQAKAIIKKAPSTTAKEAMDFCETRNYLNAKYTVGMEELAKVKGFNIDLFLYYLVLKQKNNLGKEYLASLDSPWTKKLIEEYELLNQKEFTLYGKAGEAFVYAKKIETFTVHTFSEVLWKMNWLKKLIIIDAKEKVALPNHVDFLGLESLTVEAKELRLDANLPIKTLVIKKCKSLEIEENFQVIELESIKLEACSFKFKVFQDFLENTTLENLTSVEIYDFSSYKLPKNLEAFFREKLPKVALILKQRK